MAWYLIPVVLGVVVMPWVGWPRELLIVFAEGGAVRGFGYWSGLALFTTPIIFGIYVIGWFAMEGLGIV